MKKIGNYKTFDGWVENFTHSSQSTNGPMTFAIYLPPQTTPVPVLYWLSGLTCNHENFMQKAGAQQFAAKHGIAVVAPDTSPRGANIEGEDDSWDFGTGAGFYLDATQSPWSTHYNMYSYITDELPKLIEQNFPVTDGRAISGHSMGGHGALTIGLKNPGRYQSVSAFSPICAPTQCPWGHKAFSGYLGSDPTTWNSHDASYLVKNLSAESQARKIPWLVDQGGDDEFLEQQLKPESLLEACQVNNLDLRYRLQDGYDHSYYFIASFVEDHIRFHAEALGRL